MKTFTAFNQRLLATYGKVNPKPYFDRYDKIKGKFSDWDTKAPAIFYQAIEMSFIFRVCAQIPAKDRGITVEQFKIAFAVLSALAQRDQETNEASADLFTLFEGYDSELPREFADFMHHAKINFIDKAIFSASLMQSVEAASKLGVPGAVICDAWLSSIEYFVARLEP